MGGNSRNCSKGGIISSIILIIISLLGIPSRSGGIYTYTLFTSVLPLLGGAIFLIVWSLNKNLVWSTTRGVSVTVGGICTTGAIAHVLMGATNIVLIIVWSVVGVSLTYLGFAKRKQRTDTDINNK